MENLMEVEIPDDVEKKLKEADAKEEEELEKEEERRKQEEERKKSSDAKLTDGKQQSGLIN